jgi:hypothetical protein
LSSTDCKVKRGTPICGPDRGIPVASELRQEGGRTMPGQNGESGVPYVRSQAEQEAAERTKEQHEFQRVQTRTNHLIALFNGLLVLATVCTILVGIWQARISKRSADAAAKAASAAQSAAETATKTLGEMRHGQGAQDTHTLAQQASVSADAAHIAAETAQDALHLSQRAWVIVDHYDTIKVPNQTDPKQIPFDQNRTWFQNVGSTPAHDIYAISGQYWKDGIAVPGAQEGSWMNRMIYEVKRGAVPSGASIVADTPGIIDLAISPDARPMTPGEIKQHGYILRPDLAPSYVDRDVTAPVRYQIGGLAPHWSHMLGYPVGPGQSLNPDFKAIIVIYGTVFYRDQFRIARTTDFCAFRVSPASSEFSVCPVHNDVR